MDSRWFTPVVIVLWVATMAWLTIEKVVPQLSRGEPPNYHAILANSDESVPNSWVLYLNDREIGDSETRLKKDADGMTKIHNRLTFNQFPIQQILPDAIKKILPAEFAGFPPTGATIRSVFEINDQDHLKRLEARVRWGDIPNFIYLSGEVKEGELRVFAVAMGNIELPTSRFPLASETILSESLVPQSRLPDLRLGQAWTLPVFSPLQPTMPIEYMRAEVAREEPISWSGKAWRSRVIEYTRQGGAGGPQDLQGQVWVREDGLVLKQESRLLNAKLTFIRRASVEKRDDGTDE